MLAQEIANDILSEQTPKRLFAVRGKLYELLVNCIPPELILKKLMLELVRKLDDELKHKVADCAAFFEHRLQVCAAVTYLSDASGVNHAFAQICVQVEPLFVATPFSCEIRYSLELDRHMAVYRDLHSCRSHSLHLHLYC